MLIYNLFPLLVGPLANWKCHLSRASDMGFEWVLVNPIHLPGRSGSIYSISDYFKVNPLFLNPNDTRSPEDQFREVTKYATELGLQMMADLVLNHCAVDSSLTREHPEWFIKRPNDQFAHPYIVENGEVVIWSDLVKFSHSESAYNAGFYSFTLEIVEYLVSLGFKGFRCDSAYQIPSSFWTQFIFDIKDKVPNCMFIAETLGCSILKAKQTASTGFDYIYNSAKWWNYDDKWLLQQHDLLDTIRTISFPETHDTERLYSASESDINLVKQRCIFTAFFSAAWLITIGLEFGFVNRLSVSRTRSADWESINFDLQAFITQIIKTKKRYAVLREDGFFQILPSPNPSILMLWKSTKDASQEAIFMLNKDSQNSQYFNIDNFGSYIQFAKKLEKISPEFLIDTVPLTHFAGELGPGQSMVFVGSDDELEQQKKELAFINQSSTNAQIKMNDTGSSLCILPWIHSCIMPSGNVKLCCVSGSGKEDTVLGSVWDNSIFDIYHSETLTNIRQQMLSGMWPSECIFCKSKEQIGIQSSRQIHNELHEPYFHSLKKNRERFTPKIHSLDLRIDNTCNFKCRSCSGFCSTSWFNDHNIIYPENPIKKPNIDLRFAARFRDELLQLFTRRLDRLHFAGGEPLISEMHYELLTDLINLKRFSTELYYDTNLSFLEFKNRDIIKLWDLFPNVTVSLSLDGIGAQGEYIRHGLNFDQWCNNVNRLNNELPHIKRKLHFVISVFNILNLQDDLSYIIEKEFVKPDMIRLTFLEWPAYLNVQILPKHLKSLCKSKLSHLSERMKNISTILTSQLIGLMKFLEEKDLYNTHAREFSIKTAQIDKLRGESGIKLFPQISELFKMR